MAHMQDEINAKFLENGIAGKLYYRLLQHGFYAVARALLERPKRQIAVTL